MLDKIISTKMNAKMVKIKGNEITPTIVKDSFNRRAMQFKNKIITVLQSIGVKADDVDIELERLAIKRVKADATWYMNGHRMHYSNNSQEKYVDNLFIVMKVIENEVALVIAGTKPIEEFYLEFKEESDVEDTRKQARAFFGLEHDTTDIDTINKKYKELAKELHPDMPNGDIDKFKELNHHHKILKRELM